MHAFTTHEGPVESFFNFIQNPLGVLWLAFWYGSYPLTSRNSGHGYSALQLRFYNSK